jgi:hypothetical protein
VRNDYARIQNHFALVTVHNARIQNHFASLPGIVHAFKTILHQRSSTFGVMQVMLHRGGIFLQQSAEHIACGRCSFHRPRPKKTEREKYKVWLQTA